MASTQMPQIIASMQALLQLFQCSRRKTQPAASKGTPRVQSDSDIRVKSDKSQNARDISDLSTDDYSDDAALTDCSTDRSSTVVRTKGGSKQSWCIAPPPGLEPIAASATGQSFPIQASPQHSMEGRMRARQGPHPASVLAKAQGHNWDGNGADFASLKGLLDKLSPQEAAALKGMLEERSSSRPAMASGPYTSAPVQPPRKNISSVANEINGALFAAAGVTRTTDMHSHEMAYDTSASGYHLQQARTANLHPREMAYDTSALGYQLQQARFANFPEAPFKNARPVAPRNSVKQTGHANVQGEEQGSMSTFLRDLSMTDNARVLMVRKIAKLGFDAPSILQAYFSTFGDVERVMAGATKQSVKTSQRTRLRPATVGFVVFDQPEQVEAALNHGSVHVVGGEPITVGRFQSHSVDDKD